MLASSTLNFGSLLLNSPSHNPTKTFLLPPNQPFLKSSNPISKNSFLKSTRFSAETAVAAVDSSDASAKEGGEDGKKSYHFVVANAKFMLDEEEHFQELMGERLRLYGERNMEQDFWLVIEPKFLDKFPTITNRLNRPAVALVSTNAPWITCVSRLDFYLRNVPRWLGIKDFYGISMGLMDFLTTWVNRFGNARTDAK